MSDVLARLGALPAAQRAQVERESLEATAHMLWVPNPGPQTEAYFCEADELLYGGEPGGGKTDLLAGLALTAHHRSLVLRRTNKEAEKLIERFKEVVGHSRGLNENSGVWRLNGRIIDIGGCQLEKDKQKRKGVPHDLKAFDEIPDFTRTQYEFITTWNRSTNPAQRCRIVCTANPPTNPEGVWVIEYWAAWLDPKHPNPAKSGEIRWYLRVDRDLEVEVDGPGPHKIDGKTVVDENGKPKLATSRCFIRSRLEDNPDLAATNYGNTLASKGGEMSAMAKGDFEAALQDAPDQCIPTEWVRAAQDRWSERSPDGVPMCAMGVDCSGGAHDPMKIAPRYDGWFAPIITVEASSIPKDRPGKYCAGQVLGHRRNRAIVVVDMGGGHGGGIYEQLKDNEVEVIGHKGMEPSTRRTADSQYGFFNKRSEVIWKFREALDPSQPGGSPIALPPNPRLLADLTAPKWWVTPRGIQVEPKEDVCSRLGRSTDDGDAVVQAWSAGPTYVTHGDAWREGLAESGRLRRRPVVVMGRKHQRKR